MERRFNAPLDAVTQNKQTAQYEVLTEIGQTVEDTSGSIDTEPTDGTKGTTDRQWTDSIIQQWTP